MKMNRVNIPAHSGIVAAMVMIVIVAAGLFVSESAYAFSSTDIKTDEGVVGGYIYFDESTGAITGCDTTVTEVDIPEQINGIKVKSIGNGTGNGVFRGVVNLSRISFPDSLLTIENNAFVSCNNLIEVTIPKGVTDLDEKAFVDCFKLEYINIEEGNPYYYSQEGVVFENTSTGAYLYMYPQGNTRTEYTIPDNVTGIRKSCFYRQSYIQEIIMPDSIEAIADYTFGKCKNLRNITLSDNLWRIGQHVFLDCNMLENIILPETLTVIDAAAFENCMSLKNVVIPSSVVKIGNNAFNSCPNVVIYGEYDSYAEEYAEVNNFQFVSSSGFRIDQTINGSSSITKTYGCSPFMLDISAKTALSYESSDTEVATVSAEGVVTVKGGGSATITATAAESEKYNSTEKKITLTVGQASQTISGEDSISKTYGCSTFSIGASAKTGMTYKSSNTNVAEVSSNGKVTVKSGGTAIITVTAAQSQNYRSAVKEIALTVNKATQTISGNTSFSKTCKSGVFYLGAAAKTGMTYKSNNPDVATVSPSGEVTVKGIGAATITINAEETEKYKAATKKVTVTVGKAPQSIAGKTSFSKTYGCSAFSLGASAKTTLTYRSSNTDIATVSSSGKVTVKSGGTAIITITAAETGSYKAATKKVTVTVGKAPQSIAGKTSFSKTYGCSAFSLGASAKTGLTYKSSNTAVATVSARGTITVKGGGTATITVTAKETEKYKGATKKVTVKVNKASQTISGKTSFTKTYGCSAFSLGASAKTGLTYKSSNTKVAAVSSSGKMTFKNPGKATITVTAKSTSKYKGITKKVTVSSALKKPTLTAKASGSKKIKLTWSQVPGATGYKVYIYDMKTKKYICRLTKSAKVKSVVHKGLTANKTYYYKVRAYRVIDEKNVYSTYSEAKKAKAKK